MQRAHFAIFAPSASNPDVGTLIYDVGAPMAGYQLEFKRNHSVALAQQPHTKYSIGQIDSQHVVDSTNNTRSSDPTPKGSIERTASQVPEPGIIQNFMAPLNEVSQVEVSFVT